ARKVRRFGADCLTPFFLPHTRPPPSGAPYHVQLTVLPAPSRRAKFVDLIVHSFVLVW
uniref:Uncharacterized protein n=1 Tax=Anopheles arabiensis TaxID=7173 RepID=A0A182IHM8_ANOAR